MLRKEIRRILTFMLMSIINAPLVSVAQSIHPFETQNILNQIILHPLILSLIIIAILFILIGILFKNYKILKDTTNEVNYLNDLRKEFIDADNRLIYLKDENLKYIFVNKALEEFYHKSASEIIGRDDFDITDKEFADIRRKTDLDVLERLTIIEDKVKWANRIYKTNKFPIKLLNGKYGVGAYIEDITEALNRKAEEEKNLLRNSILLDVFTNDFNSSHEQLDYVLSKALELTQSKFGYIYLYDEEHHEFTLSAWTKGIATESKVIREQVKKHLEKAGLFKEILRNKTPIVVNCQDVSNVAENVDRENYLKISKFMVIPVIIDNRIVAFVGLTNKQGNYDHNDVYQITVLMTGVWNARDRRERTIALEKANIQLNENKDKLQLILDSTAEAIYGIDKNGNCTFCNASCLKMLGYESQEDLIGKNMHWLIHHSSKEGILVSEDQCKIFNAFISGEGAHMEDEVFWRADGTCFNVSCFSYPQYKEGEVIGAVVTFIDITERKKAEEEIKYLSYHDSLTGLYNRMFYEEELKRLDMAENLPISIIVGDVNGLKLTNDIFGHDAGDTLLKKVADTFKKACRVDDIIARVGGDEFVVLLPKTELEEAEKIMLRIKNELAKEKLVAVRGSISMGTDAKIFINQDIFDIQKNAEDKMYLEKTLDRKNMNRNQVKTIIDALHMKSAREKKHSKIVSEISLNIGQAMDLSDEELKKLKDASYFHDIGKVILQEELIQYEGELIEEDNNKIMQHPVVGYRILNSFDDTLDLAESVLAHHERWDGQGYPKGLKGEQIPKLARIIAVAESFDAMINDRNSISEEEAVEEIHKQAGTKFDPEIVKIFVNLMRNN